MPALLLRVWHVASVCALLGALMPQTSTTTTTTQYQSSFVTSFRSITSATEQQRSAPPSKCRELTNHTIHETCQTTVSQRLNEWRDIYVHLCPDTSDPKFPTLFLNATESTRVSLYDLLILEGEVVEQGYVPDYLSYGAAECFQSDAAAHGSQCIDCLERIRDLLLHAAANYRLFLTHILNRLDCYRDALPQTWQAAVGHSRDHDDYQRRFSPNATCYDCEMWYWRWMLVTVDLPLADGRTFNIWKYPPCPTWCHYAELACPFLNTAKENEYAGLPAFRCNDPQIPVSVSADDEDLPSEVLHEDCKCIHPCDLLYNNSLTNTSTVARHIIERLDCPNRTHERRTCFGADIGQASRDQQTRQQQRAQQPSNALHTLLLQQQQQQQQLNHNNNNVGRRTPREGRTRTQQQRPVTSSGRSWLWRPPWPSLPWLWLLLLPPLLLLLLPPL